jgi:hypothetical protein
MSEVIIIGQEAICPDGLGRVKSIQSAMGCSVNITVQTYMDDRSCSWARDNVELINPRGKQ